MTFKQPKAKRPITEIIVHCTATREGQDISVQTIREWHTAKPPIGRGWSDIGYHWVVLLDGTVQAGRPEALQGAHCADKGKNVGTLGVVYVGGVAKDGKTPKDTRTPAQKKALLAHVKALIERYPTITKVTGHNQYANKACPSFDVRKDELGKLFKKPKVAPKPILEGATHSYPQTKPPANPYSAPVAPVEPTRNDGKFEAPKSEIGFWGRVINRLLGKEP